MLVLQRPGSWPPALIRAQVEVLTAAGFRCQLKKGGRAMAVYGKEEIPPAVHRQLDALEDEYDEDPTRFRRRYG